MSKTKFQVEFTLKQHTPIIHFQSDQKGATLRATELKSKLDRFITKQLKTINYALYDEYKGVIQDETLFPPVSEKKGCNAYKITIYSKGISQITTPKAYVNTKKETDKTIYQAPYFADTSKSIMVNSEVLVTIKSFHVKLLELLDKCKDYIFIYENFGTRQSKGFGSYLRNKISDEKIKIILSQHQNKVFKLGSYGDYRNAFLMIDSFYKELKMGINKPYKKSLIFKYICNKHHLGWEKKFIKNNFPEVIHGEHSPAVCQEPDDKEFRYIRAMLGLAEHNEFRPGGNKKQIKIKSTSGIERFKSPITFKVFNNTVYLMFDNSYKRLYDKEFNFNGKPIRTPKESEFDMYAFLTSVCKETKLEEVVL